MKLNRALIGGFAALALLAPTAHAATLLNPAISTVAPDPSAVRGPDGAFHVYASSDDWGDGSGYRHIPHFRSFDLVEWEYLGDAFTGLPPWAVPGSFLWSPDVHKVDDEYRMYFTLNRPTNPLGDPCIGLATAPTSAGPWTYEPAPIVCNGDGYHPDLDAMDPFVDFSGEVPVMYMGNFEAVHAVPMTDDGRALEGEPVRVVGTGAEAPTVIHRNGYVHLLLSRGHCCLGENAQYHVVAGRADGQFGPFIDSNGVDLLETPGDRLLEGNDQWVGPGHTDVVTDDAGQDWLLYHAAPRGQAVLPNDVQYRQMLIDRLDWVDDRPVVAGPTSARPANPTLDLPVRLDKTADSIARQADVVSTPVELASTGQEWRGQMWATLMGPDKVRRTVAIVTPDGDRTTQAISIAVGEAERHEVDVRVGSGLRPGRYELVLHVGPEQGRAVELATYVLQVDAPGTAPEPGPIGSPGPSGGGSLDFGSITQGSSGSAGGGS